MGFRVRVRSSRKPAGKTLSGALCCVKFRHAASLLATQEGKEAKAGREQRD